MADQILIIEDETHIARILSLELTHEGYSTETASTGKQGLERALEGDWSLILLDIMLPELNGLEVLRRIRNTGLNIPVILLTARDAIPDKVAGLDLGADDYMTKPFEIEELLARVRMVLRQRNPVVVKQPVEPSSELSAENLTVHTRTREVARSGQIIELTPKEFDLLVFLLEHKGEPLSREAIVSNVWRFDFMGDTNIVDVYIGYLRKKIDQHFSPSLIQTIRGVGYAIKEKAK